MISTGNILNLAKSIEEFYARHFEEKQDWCIYALNFKPKHTDGFKNMFIMQNPGTGGGTGQKLEDFRKIIKDEFRLLTEWRADQSQAKLEILIGKSQEGLRKWLAELNPWFHPFFWILAKKQLCRLGAKLSSDYDASIVEHYLSDGSSQFLEDFYVTDFIKIRGTTNAVDEKILSNKPLIKFHLNILEEEIQAVQPEWIFIFSNRTWINFYERYYPKLTLLHTEKSQFSGQREINAKSILNVHGRVFKFQYNTQSACYLMPFAHFTRMQNYIFDTYFQFWFDYFKDREFNRKDLI